jgi:hypothetical protein
MSSPAAAPRPRPRRQLLLLYAPADEAFARGYLTPALGLRQDDSEAGLAISSAELARRPVQELARLLAESRVVLPVVSPAFLVDPWLQLSDDHAAHQALAGGARVVPLLLADCEVPLHLRATVALDFRRRDDWDDELARLRTHLDQPELPAQPLGCPYPGMRPFRAAEAAFFHGREDDLGELLERLRGGRQAPQHTGSQSRC